MNLSLCFGPVTLLVQHTGKKKRKKYTKVFGFCSNFFYELQKAQYGILTNTESTRFLESPLSAQYESILISIFHVSLLFIIDLPNFILQCNPSPVPFAIFMIISFYYFLYELNTHFMHKSVEYYNLKYKNGHDLL
jgi:hypothetical protein